MGGHHGDTRTQRRAPLQVLDGPLRARWDPVGDTPDSPQHLNAHGARSAPHRRSGRRTHHERGAGRLRRFFRDYGWPAYAVPVLTVITVIALADVAAHRPAQDLPQRAR